MIRIRVLAFFRLGISTALCFFYYEFCKVFFFTK
jgi:hypothetical protein